MATRLVSRAKIINKFNGEPKYDSERPWRSGTWMEWNPDCSAKMPSSIMASRASAALSGSGRGWS